MGHVFNVPISKDFEHVENVLHETFTASARRRQLLQQASPISHVTKNSPPTLLIHGDKDEVVPLQQSVVLAAKLKQVGVPVKLVIRKDGGHPWPDFWQVDSPQLADWFDEYLKVPQAGNP